MSAVFTANSQKIEKLANKLSKEKLAKLIGVIGAAVYSSDSMGDDTERVDAISDVLKKFKVVPKDLEQEDEDDEE
jgi:hypothetical protein